MRHRTSKVSWLCVRLKELLGSFVAGLGGRSPWTAGLRGKRRRRQWWGQAPGERKGIQEPGGPINGYISILWRDC